MERRRYVVPNGHTRVCSVELDDGSPGKWGDLSEEQQGEACGIVAGECRALEQSMLRTFDAYGRLFICYGWLQEKGLEHWSLHRFTPDEIASMAAPGWEPRC